MVKDLFAEKQKFMFAVLEAKVLTSKGKSIIHDHQSSNDAQKAYKLIKEHHEKSTRALMEASELLSYITSTKLGPSGDWKGPTHLFILINALVDFS